MARLTGDEARKWLQANPNSSFTDNISGQSYQAPEKDKGILEKILLGVTKPFRQGAGVAQEFGYTLADIINMAQGKDTVARPENYALLSKDESQQLYEDPLKTGLKSGAGIAAYAVPGGASKGVSGLRAVGQAAGRGAGAGALAGFGGSDNTNELASILKGAGLGGLIGGSIQGVGEGVKALKNIGKADNTGNVRSYLAKQRGEAIGLDPNRLAKARGVNVKGSTQGGEVIDDFFNTMDELGLSTRTSNIASTSSDQALSKLGENFNGILNQADNVVQFDANTTKSILDNVNKAVGNNESVLRSSIYKELQKDLLDLGSSYTPSQLNTVREGARNLINFARSGKLSNAERGASAFFDSLDEVFKSSVPESADILSKMKNIYTVRPFIQGKAVTADFIPLGTASTNIKVPTFGVNEAIGSTIGKVAQKGIKLPTGGGGVISQIANAGQRVAPAIVGSLQGQQPQQELPQQTQELQQSQQGGQELQGINYLLADAVLQGKISATEAKAVMELLGIGGEGGAMSANQSKATALQSSLDNLRSLWGSAGIGTKIGEALPGQGIGEGSRSLDNAKRAVAEDLGRLQSQGAINEQERVEFLKRLPNVWDSQAVAEQKFQSIQNIINSYLQ